MLENFKKFFEDEYEDDGYEETYNENEQEDIKTKPNERKHNERELIKIFTPVSKTITDDIIKAIRNYHPCIINLKNVDDDDAKYIINTIAGGLYVLNGELELIGDEVYLCTPKNYKIIKEQNK